LSCLRSKTISFSMSIPIVVGEGLGSTRSRDQPRVTFSSIARQQPIDPARMHAVRRRELGDCTTFPQMCLNQTPAHVHRRLPPRCRRCLDTSLADVLVSHTIVSTELPHVTTLRVAF